MRTLLVLILTMAAIAFQPGDTFEGQTSYKTWMHYGALMDRIESLPPWDTDVQYQPGDWAEAIEIAGALQKMEDQEVVLVLVGYMSRHSNNKPRDLERASSKPQIVLRLMFDIPLDATYPDPRFDTPDTAALHAIHPVRAREQSDLIAVPVGWANGLPSLSTSPEIVDEAGIGSKRAYEPHRDFAYLLSMFTPRKGLPDLIKRLHLRDSKDE